MSLLLINVNEQDKWIKLLNTSLENLLVVGDNGHVIFLVDVTGDVVFPVFTVNGNVVFLVVEVTWDVLFFVDDITGYLVFPVGDAVYDLRVVVPDGILHNTTTSPPLPPGNQQFNR